MSYVVGTLLERAVRPEMALAVRPSVTTALAPPVPSGSAPVEVTAEAAAELPTSPAAPMTSMSAPGTDNKTLYIAGGISLLVLAGLVWYVMRK